MANLAQGAVTQAEFNQFKEDFIKLFERLESKLIIRLSSVIFAAVGVAFIASSFFFF